MIIDYACPMHPKVTSSEPGTCRICYMDLVAVNDTDSAATPQKPKPSFTPPKIPWTDWLPLMVVIGYIFGMTFAVARLTDFTLANLLSYSMGFFFIIFSLFKLINLSGFAMGYHGYDIISKRWFMWGYIAPFIEFALGFLYLARVDAPPLHVFTILFSIIICIGVGIKLARREVFQCACLGTVLKVPLTKVSLVEYAVMSLMALAMLVGVTS